MGYGDRTVTGGRVVEASVLLQKLQARYQAVSLPGLMGISAPPLNDVPSSPWMMIRPARDLPNRYVRSRARGQMVDFPIEVILLVATNGEQPREEARLDPLIPLVIDAVTPEACDMDIADILKVNSSEIDHLYTEVVVERRVVEWGAKYCYGAYITFDSVIRRQPLAPQLRGVTP